MKKNLVLVLIFMLVMSIVPMVSAQDGIESVCLVTDAGRVNDGTFNQFAHEGATAAAEDYELEYKVIETIKAADYAANVQTCLGEGYDVIATIGYFMQDTTLTAAIANPEVYFIGVDQAIVDGPSNYVGVQFREDQAGFLVGVLAALVANENDSDIIAGVYGIDVPAVKRFRNGYEQGALYVNPDWEIGTNILGVYSDSFEDQAQGVSHAQQLLGEGASVIFGAGGPLGSAAIAEAAKNGVYVIGVDKDEYYSTFSSGDTEGAEFLISSAVKRVDQGVYDMIAALAEGDMEAFHGGQIYLLDAAADGVGYAEAHDAEISEEIIAEVDAVLEMLIAGELDTNVDPVSGDVLGAEPEMEATEESNG